MIEMDRNNVGLFRWDGRSSLRDAAPCNQPGNRHLRSDDGNRGIDCNSGRLVHDEILRHLRAIRACLAFRRVRGFLFAGVSFIHGNLQQKTTGQLVEDRRIPSFSVHFSKRDRDFRQESTISVFFNKRRTGNCSPDSNKCLRFRARSHIESAVRAKCFCSPLANYFRTSAISKRVFAASLLQ